MNKNLKLKEFLKISREVTDNYILAVGKWSLDDQWKKIREEVREFEHAPQGDNELEEFWDCFFSKLTLLHLEDYPDSRIYKSAIETWNKIHNRSIKKVEEMKEHAQATFVTKGEPHA